MLAKHKTGYQNLLKLVTDAPPTDHDSHDVLLCIGTNSTINEEKRMKMVGALYVRSEQEMRTAFSELPEAVDNSWKIAEQCDLEIEFGRLHMPEPELPPGETSEV